MAELVFNDGGVAKYGDPEREIYDQNKKRWPEGELMRHGDALRVGSICSVHGELHTVEELTGAAECGCAKSTEQQTEQREALS